MHNEVPPPVGVDMAVAILNRLLAADPKALHELCEHRVPCSDVLAADPTCQVASVPKGAGYSVGLLGILNAIFGADAEGVGYIAGIYDLEGGAEQLVGFQRMPPRTGNAAPGASAGEEDKLQ